MTVLHAAVRSASRIGAPLPVCLLVLLSLAPSTLAQSPGDLVSAQKVSDTAGGFAGTLSDEDGFGTAAAGLGDLDGDGVPDVAIGVDMDDDGGNDRGAVWVLFLAADGSVSSFQKISDTQGGFGGGLDNNDGFGRSITSLGDHDGDGNTDLAVGALGDGTGGNNRGAVWIVFLDDTGNVLSEQVIGDGKGGFGGDLDNNDGFGRSVASIGDLDGDGIGDLAVGTDEDDDGGNGSGAVWILFLDTDGTVKSEQKISSTSGGFGGDLDNGDSFGRSVASLGDLDGDGTPELAVGAVGDDDGAVDAGAVWILSLAADGTVAAQTKVSGLTAALAGQLAGGDGFGLSAAGPGDVDGDGLADLVVGIDGGETGTGAAWLLSLTADGSVLAAQRFDGGQAALAGSLGAGDRFGSAVAAIGDLDGDGQGELAVGASGDDDGGFDRGATWTLFLEPVPSGGEPFVEPTGAIEGRPGRVTLLPVVTPQEDFIDEPVIIVPRGDGGSVNSQGISADGDFGTSAEDIGQFESGNGPSDSGTGSFNGAEPGFAGAFLVPDIVTANRGDDSVSLLIGAGDGTLAPPIDTPLLVDTAPVAIEVADLDGDGNDDVAVVGATGVTTLLGDGIAGFGAQSFTPVADPTDLAIGDVDNDGVLDVVVASGRPASGPGDESGSATVLLGVGDGSLIPGAVFAQGQAVASVLLGDADGGGALDALLAIHEFDGGPNGEPQGRLQLHAGDGAGGFAPASFTFTRSNDLGLHATYGGLGDLAGNGLLDAVYSSSDNIAYPVGNFSEEFPPLVVTILENDGLGGFDAAELGTAYSGKGVGVILTDFTPAPLDGITDVALVWYQDGQAGAATGSQTLTTYLAVLAGDGAGSFFNTADNQFETGDEPGNADLADVDDDGDLDILVPNREDNSLSVLLGDGLGDFVPGLAVPFVDALDPGTLPPGDWVGGPVQVEFGELQVVDGVVEFGFGAVVRNEWEDVSGGDPRVFASLSLYLANGLGGFFSTQYLPLPRGGDFTQVDITGDGNTDVVVTQYRGIGPPGDEVRIHVGLGPTTADVDTTPLSFPAPAGHLLTGGLVVADVTGGAELDVLTSSIDTGSGNGQLLVYPGTGPSLGTPVAYDLGAPWTAIRSLVLGDVTNDGIDDVLLGEQDGRLFLAAGALDGTFTAVPFDPTAATVGGGALAVSDANGDGLLDIVSVSGTSAGATGQAFVRTLINAGSGSFMLETIGGAEATTTEGRSLLPLIDDVNGDTAPDLVIVHGPADLLSVHINRLAGFVEYGPGKAGTDGLVPRLRGLGFTTPAAVPQIQLSDALGGAPALLHLGVGKIEIGILAVATVILEVPLVLPGTPGVAGEGGFTLPLPLPDLPELVGLELTFQVLVLDPGAGPPAPFSLAASNGLALTIVE